MAPRVPQPQRIRFRRSEIADLDALPSAGPRPAGGGFDRRRLAAGMRVAAGLLLALVFLVAGGLYLVSASGLGEERLRAAAEHAIERLIGRDVATAIGRTRISIDGTHLIGLEVTDLGITDAGEGQRFVQASSVNFGLELLPLLSGRVAIDSAALSGAKIDLGALRSEGDALAHLRDEQGLVDPDRVPPVLFSGLKRVFNILTASGSTALTLSDVSLVVPVAGEKRTLVIESADVASADPAGLSLRANGSFEGRAWTASGQATRDAASGRIADLDLALALPAEGRGTGAGFGAADVAVAAAEGTGATMSKLTVTAAARDIVLETGDATAPPASVDMRATIVEGRGRLDVERIAFAEGATLINLTGAVGPRPSEPGAEPAYRFGLAGKDQVLAVAGPPEAPLHFDGTINGTLAPLTRRLSAERFGVASGTGRATGTAVVTFVAAQMPAVDFSIDIDGMPVAAAKQFWPSFAAGRTRRWVLENVEGGTVTSGKIDLRLEEGRIGDGKPLEREELDGTVAVAGARLRMPGALPPLEGTEATVSFKAGDVDIAVSKGAMTLPSGTVTASNGTFAVRDGPQPPSIGKLEIDAGGDARAVAELVALDPIDAFRAAPFAPSDLAGKAMGHLTADIPLRRDVPRSNLDWLVVADFDGLSLAKDFDGQKITDAKGTLTADPLGIGVKATAKLNGAEARLDIQEPLAAGSTARQRRISLTLDDKAREAISPGLSAILTGPVVLNVDAADQAREVKADLSKAKIDLPWIGWGKGAGVPAQAAFTLVKEGDATSIKDLTISGDSFKVSGGMEIGRDGLRSARFGSVQLNRGDDLSVDVRRDGGGYAVSVRGSAIDGRALVKAATANARPGAGTGSDRSPPITVDARLDSVAGFNGEALRGVTLTLRSGPAQTRSLTIQARTDTGRAVSVQDDTTADGSRKLSVQTDDGGSMLRFLNIYSRMQGGHVEAALSGSKGAPLSGQVSARSFTLVDEPRLGSLVSARAQGSDRSLNEAVRSRIDTSKAQFSSASAEIEKGADFLRLRNGVLRGAAIGSTFQGTVFDAAGRMDMTGTFMPAYGLNRLFGELPLIGIILGNGNDRGLLGVTFKLEGDAKSPTVIVNPLSIIAPGIFRQIFEFSQ